jgi:hypothetical protein
MLPMIVRAGNSLLFDRGDGQKSALAGWPGIALLIYRAAMTNKAGSRDTG